MPASPPRPTPGRGASAAPPARPGAPAEGTAPAQAPLFPASELEPAPPRPGRLKTLLLKLDRRRGTASATAEAEAEAPRRDPLRRRTELWIDSFFDK